MSDEITLYRNIDGEYLYRFFTVQGGDFQTLLAAVKSLPFRKFNDSLRAWCVRKDGIEALKAQGFEVKPFRTIRVVAYPAHPGGMMDGNGGWLSSATVNVEYMANNDREYRVIKGMTIRYHDDAERDAAIAAIEERAAAARKILNSFKVRDLEAWKAALSKLK